VRSEVSMEVSMGFSCLLYDNEASANGGQYSLQGWYLHWDAYKSRLAQGQSIVSNNDVSGKSPPSRQRHRLKTTLKLQDENKEFWCILIK